MIGPIWAGLVFQKVGIRSPFWIAAGVMLCVRVFAATVQDEADAVEEGSGIDERPPTDPL